MNFTAGEMKKLESIELRVGCKEKDGKFHCYYRKKGAKTKDNIYDTAEECNARYDELTKAKPKVIRPPAKKGYVTIINKDGSRTFKVGLTVGGITRYVCTIRDDEELAHSRYLVAYEKHVVNGVPWGA